jgi:hypothetical protein
VSIDDSDLISGWRYNAWLQLRTLTWTPETEPALMRASLPRPALEGLTKAFRKRFQVPPDAPSFADRISQRLDHEWIEAFLVQHQQLVAWPQRSGGRGRYAVTLYQEVCPCFGRQGELSVTHSANIFSL